MRPDASGTRRAPTFRPLYLDYAATTPVDSEVRAAMEPFFSEEFGNPSSLHSMGQCARQAVDRARRQVAESLGMSPRDIIFTSGGTESDNLALFGIARAYDNLGGGHLLVSAVEHEAVLGPADALAREGFKVARLPVDLNGLVRLDSLDAALTPETILVSLMLANNEVGTIQPVALAAQKIRAYKNALGRTPLDPPFLHTDACQAAGVLDLNMNTLGADLLTLNGSKIYGPKGIGVLAVRHGIKLAPLFYGGGQERGKRAGTENVPAIIGLAKALELALARREQENPRLTALRDRFITTVLKELPNVTPIGHPTERLPGNAGFIIKGVESEILLLRLDEQGVYASAGSACTAGNAEPSHVLLAMGFSKQEARTAVRFSFGRPTTENELDCALATFIRTVRDIRQESGVYA